LSRLSLHRFEELFGLPSGYVMDFTNLTFESFIYNSVGVGINDTKYESGSGSKAKRLKKLVKLEDDNLVFKLFSDLLKYWEERYFEDSSADKQLLYQQCIVELNKIAPDSAKLSEVIQKVDMPLDNTIAELRTSLNRDLNDSRYNAALDRLHTFTIKFFKGKCIKAGIANIDGKPLQSLAGEFIKTIESNHSEMTVRILKVSISVLDEFNKIRNNNSLAHDNELVDNLEAKLIIEWILSTLNFIDSL